MKEHEKKIEQGIFKIISENPIPKPWRVRMMIGGKNRSQKFATKDEAIACRDTWLAEQKAQKKVVRQIAAQNNDKWHEWRKVQKAKQTGDKKKHD